MYLRNEFCDLLQPLPVGLVVVVQMLTIRIQHAPDFALTKQGYNDFAAGEAAAGDMPREFLHVGYDQWKMIPAQETNLKQ